MASYSGTTDPALWLATKLLCVSLKKGWTLLECNLHEVACKYFFMYNNQKIFNYIRFIKKCPSGLPSINLHNQ